MLSARDVSGNLMALPAKLCVANEMANDFDFDFAPAGPKAAHFEAQATRWQMNVEQKSHHHVSSSLTESPVFGGKKYEKCSCRFAANIHASVFRPRGGGPSIELEEQRGAWQKDKISV